MIFLWYICIWLLLLSFFRNRGTDDFFSLKYGLCLFKLLNTCKLCQLWIVNNSWNFMEKEIHAKRKLPPKHGSCDVINDVLWWNVIFWSPRLYYFLNYGIKFMEYVTCIIVYQGPHSDFAGPSCGSTACVALIRNTQLLVANAGDSRCVISRGGKVCYSSLPYSVNKIFLTAWVYALCVKYMVGIQSIKGPQTRACSWERENNESRGFHPYGTSKWKFKLVKSNWWVIFLLLSNIAHLALCLKYASTSL